MNSENDNIMCIPPDIIEVAKIIMVIHISTNRLIVSLLFYLITMFDICYKKINRNQNTYYHLNF